MAKAYKNYGTKQTSQSQPIPGKEEAMAQNNAGGYAFTIDKWSRLDRFLILGSEGGTYYVNEQELTVRNAKTVIECIEEDGVRVVKRIVEISQEGRAPKNTPALFALALATWKGDTKTRQEAYLALPKVARTGYHLLMWAAYSDNMRGTGSGWQRAVGRWFNDKTPDQLAYQAIKYQQREGWAMSDMLRLAHVKPVDDAHDAIYKWIVDGYEDVDYDLPKLIGAHEVAKTATAKKVIELISKYRLPRESIPTQFLNDEDVWSALLHSGMPMMAALRSLGKMTSVGLLTSFSDETDIVIDMFTNEEKLRKSRLHPLAILVAMRVYAQGKGMRGSLQWNAVPKIVDALDSAFYTAFGNVKPTGKNTMLALDVSGSMGWNDIAGMPITAREASAAMALVTANVEQKYMVTAFKGDLVELPLSPRERLDDVIRNVSGMAFGRTDCAQPMLYAIEKKLDIDTFVVYTDNETWAGGIHPSQALEQYQRKFDKQAKLIVVGMTATNFSIADPNSPDMLDVVGFSTATPNLISDFSLGL